MEEDFRVMVMGVGAHFIYPAKNNAVKFEPRYTTKQRRQWHPTPVLLPGKSYGWRSLVGCSPWGRKESDMTERLPFHFSLSCTGEGNGNPLQYSCLENPRDRGAWEAAAKSLQSCPTLCSPIDSSPLGSATPGILQARILEWVAISFSNT